MQLTTTDTRAEGLQTALGTIALAGTTYFVLVLVAMHVLSPGIDPRHRPTSEYATGAFGYLMTSAFLVLSAATWALVAGLSRSLRPRGAQRLGLVFLGLWGIGLLIAAAFPITPEGGTPTTAGLIHRTNGPITFLSLILGTNLTSRLFRLNADWRPTFRLASVLSLLMIPEFIAGGIAMSREAWAGIFQRALIVTFATWFLVSGARLRSSSGAKTA